MTKTQMYQNDTLTRYAVVKQYPDYDFSQVNNPQYHTYALNIDNNDMCLKIFLHLEQSKNNTTDSDNENIHLH